MLPFVSVWLSVTQGLSYCMVILTPGQVQSGNTSAQTHCSCMYRKVQCARVHVTGRAIVAYSRGLAPWPQTCWTPCRCCGRRFDT